MPPRPLLALLLLLPACSNTPPNGGGPAAPSPGMAAVLDEWGQMNAQYLPKLTPARAREVPTLLEAARAIPNVAGLPAPATEVPQVTPLTASGAEGALPAQLYRPALARDTPLVVWFPGGTWVTGSLDAADETARELSARTGWVVVAVQPRKAPEARFPAAHDDALALYQWARAQARAWGADPTRVVLGGEGPGANLALSTALSARDRGIAAPDYLLLATPLVSTALSGPSMADSGNARPLTRGIVSWAQDQYAANRRDLSDPRLNLLPRTDFAGLPPTTIILAPIDPLRSEGEALADALRAQRVSTTLRTEPGTTHGFFGLGQTVPEAAAAEDHAAQTMRIALERDLPPPPPQPRRRVRR